MGIYLILFAISTFFAYLIPRIKDQKISIALLIAIILLLSFVGGVRNFDIGTDVEVYGIGWFEEACKYDNLFTYIKEMQKDDIGYLVLNFFVSRITSNANIFLFVLQLITNSLIVVTLYRYKDKVPMWLSILSYLCIYYLRTYNYLRQSIALAIVFFAFRYIEKKKIIKYIISIIVASQFHYTGIIAILLYPIYFLINKNKKIINFIFIISMILLVCITFNIVNVMNLAHDVGIINDRIFNYTKTFLNTGDGFNLVETGFKAFIIMLYLMQFKKLNSITTYNKFLFICSILDIVLFQFRNVILYSDRISLYFGMLTIMLIPQLSDTLAFKYKNKVYLKSCLALLLLLFFYYKFVYSGSCEVYPYTSQIIHIL